MPAKDPRCLNSLELAEILAKPGAPDVQAISELRQRYDTQQVSPLTA